MHENGVEANSRNYFRQDFDKWRRRETRDKNIGSYQLPGAVLAASAEPQQARLFVDDIPSPKNCLHGAYIYSAKPLVRIRGIKLMPELQLDGVRDIISSKDIPNGGKNI